MPKISIRIKLLLLSAALLSIPYVGFRYLRETERYLQSSLEESLLAISGSLAVLMGQYPTLFQSSIEDQQHGTALFVHSLKHAVQVDGYVDDWIDYLEWSSGYGALDGQAGGVGGLSYKIILGEFEQDLYVLIQVRDAVLRYQRDGAFQPYAADTVEMVFVDATKKIRHYFFSTVAPGTVTAYRIVENWDFSTSRQPIANVVGEWQETSDGYTVELRIPLHLVGEAAGFIVYDADGDATTTHSAGTAGATTSVKPNRLIQTSAQLEQLIHGLGLKAGRRTWILNRHGQVLASGGSLMSEVKRGVINFLYTWVLPRATNDFEDELALASRLRGQEVLEALAGRAATRWRSSPDERAVIVSAASPVRLGNELIGAVVIEETTNSIQTLQRQAMADLFNKSIFVFLSVTLVLLLFATRLSVRLTRLRDDAEGAIDPYGRVVGVIKGSEVGDEIGDVSRSFAAMLERLHQYNAYLEGMAGRLAHELRTPITVVKSSLENLEQLDQTVDGSVYLERARDGVNRLGDLVRRLGEAARLEESIATAEVEKFDLGSLLAGCVQGYTEAYPDHAFRFSAPPRAQCITGAPDLIVQMLDKLIENAIDFTPSGQPIEVSVAPDGDMAVVDVTNDGAPLPADMRDQLFGSMVSIRGRDQRVGPHLGLGLYMVRLIMEFHGGEVGADNLPGGAGVRFRIRLPRDVRPRSQAARES